MAQGKPRKLNAKQRRFVEEYAADKNATQAYFRAYGRKTQKGTKRTYHSAQSAASQLLSNVMIQAELAIAEKAYRDRTRVSKDRVIREIAALAFYDNDDIFEPDPNNNNLPTPRPWDEIPIAARKAIQSVEIDRKRLVSDEDGTAWEIEKIRYKMAPKSAELDKLCKKLGFYRDEPSAKGLPPVGTEALELPDNGRGDNPPPLTE